MKKLVLILFYTFCVFVSYSQKSEVVIKVKDTVSVGTPFKLEIELKNVSGSFKTPIFQGLRLVGGPNTSTSFSMINGETTSKALYTYFLLAEEPGQFIIQMHDMESSKEMLSFEEIYITAIDTFSGDSQLIKYYESGTSNEQKIQSSKRKIRKI